MDTADLRAELADRIAELEAEIVQPLLPPETTHIKRIQRHTLLAVLKPLENRNCSVIDLTF